MALILTGSSGSTTLDSSAGLTFSDSSNQQYAASPYVLKNRIINGAMMIDQRNAGASVTPVDNGFVTDRWRFSLSQASKLTSQQSTTAPTGFGFSLLVTSSSAYTVGASESFLVSQKIEGFNFADLAWGTANAQTITVSFWVRSSLTGTFGGSISNSATNRWYPFSYTISSANTWEQKSITVAGDTSGTWVGATNGTGAILYFSLGAGATVSGTAGAWSGTTFVQPTGATSVVGTNGATFYITGVQLEVGSTATPFERRLFNQELTNCQRYYIQSYPYGTVAGTNIGASGAGCLEGVNYGQTAFGYTLMGPLCFPVTMRTNPTVTVYNPISGSSAAATCIRNVNASTDVAGYVLSASDKSVYVSCNGVGVTIRAECAITATAEL